MNYHYSIIKIDNSFLVREENLMTLEVSEEWLKNLIFFKKSRDRFFINTETHREVATKRMTIWLESFHSELLL